MKKRLKSLAILFSSVVIGLLNLPIAFAKSASSTRFFYNPSLSSLKKLGASVSSSPAIKSAYDSLSLGIKGLSREAYDYACRGFDKLLEQGKLVNDSIISILDFSEPSSTKRMFVLDLKNYKVLFNTLVAHGSGSGREFANTFSNQNSSHMSSPGFYVTRETYEGHNGLSLKLQGMEAGINDKAYQRGIVVHGAAYVSEEIARARGYIGRSWGCPAVPVATTVPLINTIKNGTCLFIYHPGYVDRSVVLR